ncbi:MAG: GntR family transcriptional regulator, partial [Pseudomonadota bacterium]
MQDLGSFSKSNGGPSATQQAYDAIRQLILTGDLQPGEKLKIERLRETLGLGASPVREALSLLTSDHLVERLDQRGFRAAATSGDDFQSILNLRCLLEESAIRQSIAHADTAWEDRLVLAHHRMAKTPRDVTPEFEARHKAFHMALLDNCGSPILLKFCSQLYDLNIRYRFIAGRGISYGKRNVADEHTSILNAAVERDAELASVRL